MRVTLFAAAVAIAILAGQVSMRAHHSFASEFDINKPVSLTGTLVKMEWVNPHGWIYIDVKRPDGTVENWAIETGSTQAMIRRGLRKTDFPLGSQVVVQGFRARNGKTVANGGVVTFADGREFALGAPTEGQ